jgi:hypothetical protein
MTTLAQSSLIARWKHRFGGQHRNRAQPRPLAALGYLVNGPVIEGLVEIENFVLVVLYDAPLAAGRLALRLAGFSGARMPWGVAWGGPQQSKLFKDLLLRPLPGARGERLDANRPRLLGLALQLERELRRRSRRRCSCRRRRLQLPRLWAGFRASVAGQITGDGPELAAEARGTGKPAGQLLEEARRTQEGLTLYPLPWVSHQAEIASAVFADLEGFPRRQVFGLRRLPEDLQGFQGAAQFDFFASRFQSNIDRSRHADGDPPARPTTV